MRFAAELRRILRSDRLRMEALRRVRTLDLPDGWIAAGFVRDAVWDRLHGREPSAPCGDVDVIWFDPEQPDEGIDRTIEATLASVGLPLDWSVKNQARMHLRNGDGPYSSAADAMKHWPETATAVAVRLVDPEHLQVCAPLGLDDLFNLRLTPCWPASSTKSAAFDERVAAKRWLERYPLLTLTPRSGSGPQAASPWG